jgi:excisionase family DNA binding protein
MSEAIGDLQRRWLSLDAAAEYASLSRRSLERLLEEGRLRSYRPRGRRRLIDRAELDQFLAGSANPTKGD